MTSRTTESIPGKPGSCPQRTLLIVEDDRTVRESLAEVLELLGFRVIQAIDGEQALQLLTGDIPDVIVIDWRLPGISGAELTSRIGPWRQQHPVRVIGISAENWHGDAMRMAGADTFLAKPLDIAMLVDTLCE